MGQFLNSKVVAELHQSPEHSKNASFISNEDEKFEEAGLTPKEME